MQLTFLGITFHVYGFILGVAAVVGIELARAAAQRAHFPDTLFNKLTLISIIGGVVGGRLWHVITDYQLYTANWWGAVAVWNGGMSIIGAVAGAFISLLIWQLLQPSDRAQHHAEDASSASELLKQFSDITVFGLPAAQAIGRLGNYVNHELFGYPTNLPWALYIPPAYRPGSVAEYSYFHPLFAYELLPLAVFAGVVWWFATQTKYRPAWLKRLLVHRASLHGMLFTCYLCFYAVLRFFLEFLRIEKAQPLGSPLSTNQWVLLVGILWCIMSIWLKRSRTPCLIANG